MRTLLSPPFLLCAVVALASLANTFAPPHSSPTTTTHHAVRSTTTSQLAAAKPGVVITGAAGGVGFAYAGEFLERGYDVVICDVKDCTAAAQALVKRGGSGNIYHTTCDVSKAADVEKLGGFAKTKLETIGYWINNAGINGGRRDLRDVPVSQVEAVVKVNLLGILLCTKVASKLDALSWVVFFVSF